MKRNTRPGGILLALAWLVIGLATPLAGAQSVTEAKFVLRDIKRWLPGPMTMNHRFLWKPRWRRRQPSLATPGHRAPGWGRTGRCGLPGYYYRSWFTGPAGRVASDGLFPGRTHAGRAHDPDVPALTGPG